jgi:hypothetical protein
LEEFMQIVRPYGSSRSKEAGKGLRRMLVEKTTERAEHDIPVFARSHDELVIAQWISTIDKIARKPAGRKRPSPTQRNFRHKLGNACWLRLIEGGHLQGANGGSRASLNDLWWFKIHPYEPGTEEPPADPDKAPKIKGRWYKVFAGDCDPEKADPHKIAEIVERIEKHLYSREYRVGLKSQPKRRGKIEARAESIGTNVLRTPDASRAPNNQAEWTDEDKAAYARPGDPVRAIREAAKALERDGKRASLDVAGKTLFKHWGQVFCDPTNGKPLDVKRARNVHPGMFALHEQLKQCYRRLLKRTRKDTREHRKQDPKGRRLSVLLPRNLDEALKLSGKQDTNADLGHLVRLGKVIHYTASQGRADRPAAIKDNWPENIEGSRFWNSDGQAEIKRAEAFVRIWRQALVLAGLTLKDWASFEGEILGGAKQLKEALDPSRFERGHFDRKLLLLFGNRSDSFTLETDSDCLDLLRGLIKGAAKLRHAVFHFKGRGQLLDELAALPTRFSAPVTGAARRLWKADAADRTARLKTTLRGAHVEHFLTPDQGAQVFGLLTEDAPAELPLPRFSRVLNRAKGAWTEDETIKLPKPANRRALEEAPARLCQYVVLKLIYERPFRSWLKDQGAEVISGWIDGAVARATEAAKAKSDETGRKVIAARAANLPKPSADSDIIDFFFDLSAATASEMRVQRGYESDREKAQEQAEYIDHLLCDVVILSFSQFLSEQKLNWALELKAEQVPSEPPTCSLDGLQTPEPVLDAEGWQVALYLVLHLLPVESVGRLLHQLFKWDITARRDTKPTTEEEEKPEAKLKAEEKARLQRLFATMTLYLDMHDAKFEGGHVRVGCEDFRILFETEQGFDRVFSQTLSQETDRRIPRRGLREIMRFGHLPLLKAVGAGRQIDDATIERVFVMEEPQDGGRSQIAVLQQRREDLHDQWVKTTRGDATEEASNGAEKTLDTAENRFGAEELREYCETLAEISKHRRDSTFVNLVDHVRVHRIIMAVLGRLVDYVGLFERDLYFTTLALLHRQGLHPEHLFEEKGLKDLFRGQIISALSQHKNDSPRVANLLKELARHFTEIWEGNPIRDIRNDLAHLNMLQGAAPAPRLTHSVNQTRRLMAYDRKLKNAVSKSVIELMAREGIELCWKIMARVRWETKVEGNAHDLADAKLSSLCAKHLGGKELTLGDNGPKNGTVLLEEKLHSDGCVDMIAAAFGGERRPTTLIVENLLAIDWKASTEKKELQENSVQTGPQRPSSGRKKSRRASRKAGSQKVMPDRGLDNRGGIDRT